MAKRSVRSARWRREPWEDEHSNLVNSVWALQIQLNSLSTHLLIAMNILVEHRQGQQQLQDEYASI
jgi:hypothetical protein